MGVAEQDSFCKDDLWTDTQNTPPHIVMFLFLASGYLLSCKARLHSLPGNMLYLSYERGDLFAIVDVRITLKRHVWECV